MNLQNTIQIYTKSIFSYLGKGPLANIQLPKCFRPQQIHSKFSSLSTRPFFRGAEAPYPNFLLSPNIVQYARVKNTPNMHTLQMREENYSKF